jgi:alcohol dehydrogenase class IV
MLLGAAFAGLAIENSMLGAAHAAANPLTAHFGTTHGQAVGIMLPHVVRFNAQQPQCRKLYGELAAGAGFAISSEDHVPEKLAAQLEQLLELGKLPSRLKQAGTESRIIPVLADEAARQWTATFNPRPVSKENFVALYQAAL